MPLFAVIRKRGAGWKVSLPLEAQDDWDAHASFMDALEADGFVVLAGPLDSMDEALIIVRADSPREVENRLAADPWTLTGMLKTTKIAEWTLRIGSLPG
jgi:uncharacterized protein YciI